VPPEPLALRAAFALLAAWSVATARAQQPADALAALAADPHLRTAHVGVAVLDLESGAMLAARDEHRAFLPASASKLVTLAVVLHTLPADFRFRTSLIARGTIADGVLHGDLVLVGSGDPSFGGPLAGEGLEVALDDFAAALRERGIARITGAVIGDGTIQREAALPAGWSVEDEAADYAAPPGGLCFAGNCIAVTVHATSPGEAPRLELAPRTDFATVACTAVTAAAGTLGTLAVARAHGSDRIDVTGTLPLDAPSARVRVAVGAPARYAAHVLREVLLRRGIAVAGAARDAAELPAAAADAPCFDIGHRLSPGLGALLAEIGKRSNNLYAEQLWRAAARAAGRDPAALTARVLGELGVDVAGLVTMDGSGLSRLDQLTPHQLVALLAAMWCSPHREAFTAALPIAGDDDTTLGARLGRAPTAGQVLAKTGTMTRVAALSGYVRRAGDRPPIAFAVLLNGFSCTTAEAEAAIDAFVTALVRCANAR
jgi:D-alanyl-D-alanine carboxypeptidase/D-alanyl-D-alanine-endopeptidase (penicillin-binding protein 4)